MGIIQGYMDVFVNVSPPWKTLCPNQQTSAEPMGETRGLRFCHRTQVCMPDAE